MSRNVIAVFARAGHPERTRLAPRQFVLDALRALQPACRQQRRRDPARCLRGPLRLGCAGRLRRAARIILGTETAPRREIEQLFARHAMPLPDNRIEAPCWLIIRQLLLESDFVAALPGSIELYEPGLRVLPVSFEPMRHSVGITTAAGRVLSPPGERADTTPSGDGHGTSKR